MCVLFAATYPERTEALITFGIYVKRVWSPDYPWAPTPEERQRWLDMLAQGWGGTVDLSTIAPSEADDEEFARWWARYLRMSAEPQAAVALGRMNTQIDVRAVLPTIHVPTLVLHNVGDRDVKIEEARYIAAQIPNARLVELPGEDHVPWTSGADAMLDEVEAFVTGERPRVEPDRVLATVLFTDIVDSTAGSVELGDAGWRARLEEHQRMVRAELEQHRGREVKTTGDGFLATFDGPARAIRCARGIRDEAGKGWPRRARRRPRGGVRSDGRGRGRDRGPHRRACPRRGRAGGGHGVADGEGPGGRIRPRVRGPRRARAQGARRVVAPVRRGLTSR